MPKKITPSFILELALETNAHDEAALNKRFEAARQLYNACLDEAKRRLDLLRQSKTFQEARSMPKTVNGKPNKERTEAFKALNASFSFILKRGKYIKTEKFSYRSFQKNYGKSVKDRAPSMFISILRRKAENAGGFVDEFPTKETKLSQYCHKCGKYKPKSLSQRWHTCCQLNIQRDLYSAFLAGSIVENKLDTADVVKRWRSTEAVLLQAVSELKQVASGRQLPSSFGLRTRDRATRLRSSDAPWIVDC